MSLWSPLEHLAVLIQTDPLLLHGQAHRPLSSTRAGVQTLFLRDLPITQINMEK
jgi:hypothetical protein